MPVKVFGIRHHGPGSARSLVRSLQALQPDMILVEGPPDANDAIPLLANAEMKPPVALLIYAPDQPEAAAYYPFAVFSPEWQAIQYGLKNNIPVRFMDLPQTHQMAERSTPQQDVTEDEAKAAEPPTATEPDSQDIPDATLETEIAATATAHSIPHDPLTWLAEAAGYNDSERWWEHMVEQRQDSTTLFDAILEAMTALRHEVEQVHLPNLDNSIDRREAQREAYMRRTIRQAQKEGCQTIAVVCGAWHSPALGEPFPAQKQDNALLKGLPKLKVQATWIPWTYS
ncbi:MAG: hypothetical protein F6K19_50085, partial [Cyanothece sp. SIO1E1]|nr:hypothetical protein [Cyanothece sp. SIO1E1]